MRIKETGIAIIVFALLAFAYLCLSPTPKTQMMYLLEDHTSCESYNISSSTLVLSNCFHPIMGKIERVINPVNVREIEFEIKDETTKTTEGEE